MKKPMRGEGRFQWNTGGWMGGLVGGTLWVLILGLVIVFAGSPLVGAALVVLYLATNIFGLYLWAGRARIRPYPALQALMAGMTVCAFAAVALVHFSDAYDLAGKGQKAGLATYWWLVFFPGMMVAFYLMERDGRKQNRARRKD